MATSVAEHIDGDAVAETVEETVEEHPWIEALTRFGWIAKGVVYGLMGLTAFTIGRHRPTPDDASPEGALGQVGSSRFGEALLVVVAVGLLLYAAWRLLSVALVRGTEARDWLNRVGYFFSAAFYLLLGLAAGRAALQGDEPKDSNSVERLSRWMLSSDVGRWTLFAGGVVVVGIGVFFVIDKGVRRSFRKDLDLSDASEAERHAVLAAGSVGWTSRGFVTAAVGFFVARAAWLADTGDARGFDRTIREVASTDAGAIAVLLTGLALVVYGVFCALIVRHLDLDRVS